MRLLGKQISLSFINGLIVLLPIVGTIYLLHYSYQLLNNIGVKWLFKFWPEKWNFPMIGVLFLVIVVCAVGFFTRLWVTRIILEWFERLINRIPLVKGLYGVLRDTIQSIFGEQKSFDTVVFVRTGESRRLGFLTVKKPRFQTQDGKCYVGVYFPQSFQVSGDLYWYEESQIEILDIEVDEAMQLILSAGVAGKK